MSRASWLRETSAAFRLAMATSWLAPESWRQRQEEAIRKAASSGLDWKEYLFLVVKRHRTPAISWAALHRVPELDIPESARQQLQMRSDACRMQAVRQSLLLAEVLKAFKRAGIPAMPCKGPLLSYELFGDVGLRQSIDLDLAVVREDVARAQACLEGMGWHLDSSYFPMSPPQWESFLRHEHHLGFLHTHAGCVLELHWRNWWDTPDLTNVRWLRSIPAVWQGCSFQAMNPSDLVLYICSHGGQHLWSRAKWLGDLARIYTLGLVDWQAALDQARRTGQERVLLAGLCLLEQVYGLPLPALQEKPWMNLPSLLIEMPLHALNSPEEAEFHSVLASSYFRLRVIRYEKLFWPRKTWRDSFSHLLYHREDFRTLCLSDSLFWAYLPLRPILWAWRFARKLSSRIAGSS